MWNKFSEVLDLNAKLCLNIRKIEILFGNNFIALLSNYAYYILLKVLKRNILKQSSNCYFQRHFKSVYFRRTSLPFKFLRIFYWKNLKNVKNLKNLKKLKKRPQTFTITISINDIRAITFSSCFVQIFMTWNSKKLFYKKNVERLFH